MSRSALVLAAHGSLKNSSVNQRIWESVETLRARGLFDEVGAGFQQGDPPFAEALDRIAADEFVVVPVMTSEGYYADEVLPRELRRNRCYPRVRVRRTPPVGTHPGILELVAARVRKLQTTYAGTPNKVSLVIVGHGTGRNPRSRAATLQLVEALCNRALCAEVLPAFLDEAPLVDSIRELVTLPTIIVIPFLISEGSHATRDLPRRLGMSVSDWPGPPFVDHLGDRLVVCDAPIGSDSGIVDIIADLARTGVGVRGQGDAEKGHTTRNAKSTLRLGTRASALALWQANHVAERLRTIGVRVELVRITTSGDRTLDLAIADLPSDSPFTDDIDGAMLRGEIDLAVHSLKDLPVDLPLDVTIAAVLPRGDASESLVSRGFRVLSELPRGSIVGTSSPRRKAQILALRPDLDPVPIRGPVNDRLEQVRRGDFGAAVLATAGLQRLGRLDAVAQHFSIQEFLPAPGQGALAITVRANDHRTWGLVAPLNHEPARVATRAELEVLRPFENSTQWVVAAFAKVEEATHRILLRARLLSPDGMTVHDTTTVAADPNVAARQVIEEFETFACAMSDMPSPVAAES